MRYRLLSVVFVLTMHVCISSPSNASEQAASQYFELHIRPLLIEHCIRCHGPDKQKGGLRLDSRTGWVKGGDSGPAIVPGNVDDSLLIKAVRYDDSDLKMPPDAKLKQEEIVRLEQWVKSGAVDPRTITDEHAKLRVADPKTFWSFQPVRVVIPPKVVRSEWTRNPIDQFILSNLDALGLKPAPQADPRTLVRRAYFDLIGLPPSPETIREFAKAPTSEAWEKLIDSLLKLPQYGERWGRHWLDVARYADSGGFETDVYYRNAWRYRDYVVKSFNDDKPYDVFVQEQIAGDELWPDDIALSGSYTLPAEKVRNREALTGTGLFALGPQIHESNMDGRKLRYETLTDWVDTTGAAFLGLTFSCARCHDHKFDPITQHDYYAMQAIFSASKEVEIPAIDAMGITDFKQHYPRILAIEEARKALRLFDSRVAGRPLNPDEQRERQNLLNQIANGVLALPEQTALGAPLVGLMETPTITVLGHERPELIAPITLLNRGELSRPREVVQPALPQSLSAASGWTEPMPGRFQNRAALAKWLTSKRHPLTSRVMVNRIWNGHFGRGLVSSVNDFGQMGERPTHPELLDWLANRFVDDGWSIKKMHRLMMLSSTYQMASQVDVKGDYHEQVTIDPHNRHFWRMNRRRLEAELIWDSIHAVAGTLNLKMGGRPVVPPLGADEGAPAYWIVSADPSEHTRRGIYILQRRNFRFPMFDVFDLPVNAVSAPARDVTTVAPQALWLLNNGTVSRQSAAFARRVRDSLNAHWNAPDFGPGQSGWEGAKSRPHAGWAKRIDNGNVTGKHDAPEGTIMTHGPTSVVWTVPQNMQGLLMVRASLWNIRRLGRSGGWKLWKNDKTLVVEGVVNDSSGTSARPMELVIPEPLMCHPGDTLRLEILEDDFVGVNLSFSNSTRVSDLSREFSLSANPTSEGWQYSESLSNGGGPLTHAIQIGRPDNPESWIERAWQLSIGRSPTNAERNESLALLKGISPERPETALPQLCLALMNLQEFCYVD